MTEHATQPAPSELAPARQVDLEAATAAAAALLEAIGEDPAREGIQETPARLAKSLIELTRGMNEDPAHHLEKVFDIGHEELVLVRDIPFHSLCEHHVLPFHGRAHVAYLPSGKVTGLSKLARVVEGYSRRLQVQERLTSQVADALVRVLNPRGVAVVMEAEHMCMTMRGVSKPGSSTVTSALRGAIRNNAATRAEVLALILPPR